MPRHFRPREQDDPNERSPSGIFQPLPCMPVHSPIPPPVRARLRFINDVFRLQRRRPRRLAVRPAGVRQHLNPHRQSHQRGAGGARCALEGGPRRSRSPRAMPHRSWCCSNCSSPATNSSPRASSMAARSTSSRTHSRALAGSGVGRYRRHRELRARGDAAHQSHFHRVDRQSGGSITDIEAVSTVARKAGVPLIVDNTLASPYLIPRSTTAPTSSCTR